MKRLIFLLMLAVFAVGFMPAQDAAHPPWGIPLEAAMSRYGADGRAAAPDTVPADIPLFAGLPAAGSINANYEMTLVFASRQLNGIEAADGLLPDYPLLE